MPEPTDEAEAAWITRLQTTYPGQFDEWGADGKHPQVAGEDDEESRRKRLRHLTERYLMVARGQGHDVRTLVGELTELVGDGASSGSGSGRG